MNQPIDHAHRRIVDLEMQAAIIRYDLASSGPKSQNPDWRSRATHKLGQIEPS